MHDLTQGSITRHLLSMAAFIGIGLIFNTLYFLIDLYFVSRLGPSAIAGVGAAGVSSFLAMGASQLIAVGAMALIAQAAGRKDAAEANLISNQALSLSVLFAAAALALGYAFGWRAMDAIAADEATAVAGREYLAAFLPSLALMFPSAALGAALRGAGIVRPTMMVQSVTVLINAALAPVLIAGWGTGVPLGVAGAGWASTIAVAFGLVWLWVLFGRVQNFVRIDAAQAKPNMSQWGRIVAIGLPAAGEFVLMFVIIGVVYWVIRHFGPHAQAGFGVGVRVMQSVFLPAMAVAFAAAPIVGQNFGAGLAARVRETFRQSALIGAAIMLVLTILCQVRPDLMIGAFTNDPEALSVGADYLRIISWNFIATAIAFTCSSMFQGLGDTRPAFLASATRLLTFAAPAIWLSGRPDVTLQDIWRLSVLSVFLQAVVSYLLLRRQMRHKLDALEPRTAAAPA